jgi:phenylalanine ammonia-lyase
MFLTSIGVNTGFGGSADTRSNKHNTLQLSLMQHTQSGINRFFEQENVTSDLSAGSHAMPFAWVKAFMLVRENQTMRGHSAVRAEVVETLNDMIRKDLIPLVPLRGSISASGDLMPLSFLAGAMQGCPDIRVKIQLDSGFQMGSADQGLKLAGIEPIVLGPKEGLGLINGTAPSAALASLALYDAHQLAVLSQCLTIIASETLGGNVEWLSSFIADVRPHVGQKEAAANMRTFVAGSRLVSGIPGSKLVNGNSTEKDRFKAGLCQDRYATRTSPQWIGPQLEDLMLAHQQVTTELNSTSDNPLVDVSHDNILSGGNFQAASITSAMEKTRLALQMLGKMLFAQCTEMINPSLNNGLPPNLAADDPSLSFTMKGIDTNMAAYMSELAFIANPVSSHVQSAEQHNQAINSLALISARYTMTAVDIVSLMSACFLYVGCQGLDLRVMHKVFLENFRPVADRVTTKILDPFNHPSNLHANLFKGLELAWAETASLDASQRCEKVSSSLIPILISAFSDPQYQGRSPSVAEIEKWRRTMQDHMYCYYTKFRADFIKNPTTMGYLGQGSKRLYNFVRNEIGVPLHQGLVEHPMPGDDVLDDRPKKIIGNGVGCIHEALRQGALYESLLTGLAAVDFEGTGS